MQVIIHTNKHNIHKTTIVIKIAKAQGPRRPRLRPPLGRGSGGPRWGGPAPRPVDSKGGLSCVVCSNTQDRTSFKKIPFLNNNTRSLILSTAPPPPWEFLGHESNVASARCRSRVADLTRFIEAPRPKAFTRSSKPGRI